MFTLRHRFQQGEGGDGGTGGSGAGAAANGAGSGEGVAGNQDASGGQQGGENNKSTILNPWQLSPKLNDDKSGAGPSPPDNKPAPTAQSASEQMAQFIKGLNLSDGIDLNNVQTELQEGKTDALNAAFETVASNVFQQAMIQTNRLVESRLDSAVDSAVNKATGKVNANFALREINEAMPFTKDPAIEPIAKAVMSGFMKQDGADAQSVVKSTQQFFEQMAKVAATEFKMVPPNSDLGENPFGGGVSPSQRNTGKVPDWLDVLAGNPSED
jgi:hypothetical protein